MAPPRIAAGTRAYDRGFDWSYAEEAAGPPPAEAGGLIPVIWDGLWLNTGDQDSGLCAVVEDIDGWLDSAPVNGNDVARTISDGSAWGPKVLSERTITISGAAAGPPSQLGAFRDQLAARTAARAPAELIVGNPGQDRYLVADVRAGTEKFRRRALGRSGFKWQVALTAVDPALYDRHWQTAILANAHEDEDTGRRYPKEYAWRYAQPYLPNSALLRNEGNTPAPVYALYEGDLTESAVADARSGIIRLAPLAGGMQILVSTATLAAEAPGGQSRASHILPGSRPMTVPAGGSSRWYLRAAGRGRVSLAWRSAWV